MSPQVEPWRTLTTGANVILISGSMTGCKGILTGLKSRRPHPTSHYDMATVTITHISERAKASRRTRIGMSHHFYAHRLAPDTSTTHEIW